MYLRHERLTRDDHLLDVGGTLVDAQRPYLAIQIERANEGLEVAGEAGGADEALEQWRVLGPDVIVLDHRMPGRTGLQVAEQILAEVPDQSIILFSAYLDDELVASASAVGIRECISKDRYDDIPDALWRYGPAA